MEAEALAVAVLVAHRRLRLDVTLDRADPALGRADHRDRLALHQRLRRHRLRLRRAADDGAAGAKRGLLPEAFADLGDLGGEHGLLAARAFGEFFEPVALRLQRLVLAPYLRLLQPAQRAQAHVEDRVGLDLVDPEGGHQGVPGRVLLAHDADHRVEVEVGDEIAAEHVEAARDRRQPMGGAAQQDIAPVLEKAQRTCFRPITRGMPAASSTFMLRLMRVIRGDRLHTARGPVAPGGQVMAERRATPRAWIAISCLESEWERIREVADLRGMSINDLMISAGLNVELDPAQTDAPALALSEAEQRRLLDRVDRLAESMLSAASGGSIERLRQSVELLLMTTLRDLVRQGREHEFSRFGRGSLAPAQPNKP